MMRPLLAMLGMLLFVGCEHPIAIVTPHAEAADIVLRDSTGAALGRTMDNRRWMGDTLTVTDGGARRLVVNLLDFRDAEFSIATRRDLTIRMEAEDPRFVQWEPLTGFGRLQAFQPGVTRVRFLVWHVTHADLVSPWIPVRVVAPGAVTRRAPGVATLPVRNP